MNDEREHRFSHCHEDPVDAPYAKGSDTSRAAAQVIAKRRPLKQAAVYLAILGAGKHGATWDELVAEYGFHPTANGRVTKLVELGEVVDSGERRKTRSGFAATVWIAKQFQNANAAEGNTAITPAAPSAAGSLTTSQVRIESPTADGEAAVNDGTAAAPPQGDLFG